VIRNRGRDSPGATADRFVIPLDIVHLTPEEYESRSSPIASFAHEGEEISAS